MRLRKAKKYNYLIILPDDPFKLKWDLFVTLVLLAVFFISPYRIAFTEDNPLIWTIIDQTIDFIFFIDLILTFFCAYYDENYVLVDQR